MITGRYRIPAEARHEETPCDPQLDAGALRGAASSRARSARRERCSLGGCERLSRTEWFPKVLGVGETAERGGGARASRRAVDGAGIRRSGSLADVPQQRHARSRTRDAVPGARGQCRFADYRLDGRRPGRRAARVSRSPSCARCRAARRSRATTASRAGARSASGRACGSRAARRGAAEAGGALRRVPLRRSDGGRTARDLVLREHRPRRRLSSADDPRLRAERRARCRSPTARRCGCASSASSATSTRST